MPVAQQLRCAISPGGWARGVQPIMRAENWGATILAALLVRFA